MRAGIRELRELIFFSFGKPKGAENAKNWDDAEAEGLEAGSGQNRPPWKFVIYARHIRCLRFPDQS
jgi:hypothetical protein